jgi:4'-phosphopantetheinyl transferase
VTGVGAAALQLWLLPRDEERLRRLCVGGLALLSEAEREWVDGARSPTLARRFLLGRVLMRRALAAHLGVDPSGLVFAPDRAGKPELVEPACPGLAFNLSHSRSEWAFALGRGAGLGVDLESVDRVRAVGRIAAAFYSDGERRRLADGQGALQLWTLKEAVIKAVGGTVWQGLREVQLEIDGARIGWLAPPPHGDEAGWSLALGRLRGDHWLSLALRSSAESGARLDVGCRVLDEQEGDVAFVLQARSGTIRPRSGGG